MFIQLTERPGEARYAVYSAGTLTFLTSDKGRAVNLALTLPAPAILKLTEEKDPPHEFNPHPPY